MPKISEGKGSIRTGDVWTQTSCKPSPPGWNKLKSEGGKEEAEKEGEDSSATKTMGNRPSNQAQALLKLRCGAGRVAVFSGFCLR